jgi:hypothetical protein
MNGFEQIKSFYSWVFNNPDKVRPTHISLYLFLLNQNNRAMWVEWFKCPYDLAMQGACIGNKNTYYKCLDDLQANNLIEYKKGINNYKAPMIRLIQLYDIEPLTEQVTVPLCGKLTEQVTVPHTEPLTELLNKNIYKLITDNYKLVNDKLETWLKIPSELKVSDNIPFQEIVDIFNSVCVDLPRVEKLTETRKKLITNRIKENSFEVLGDIFKKVAESDFLSGRKSGWKANFDWIMNPTNFVKILEDNYKNNKNGTGEKSNAELFSNAMQSETAKNFRFK